MLNLQKEQRLDKILLSLKSLDYLSTTQIQKLHNMGTDRNTRRFMQSIQEYVSCWKEHENVYYLNKKGRERVESGVVRTKISPVTHYLMRNDFYIRNLPEIFEPEMSVTIGDVSIRPDAWVKLKGGFYFLEVDNTQSMVKNQQKIEKYKKLADKGAFQQKYGYFPRILWVTALAGRKQTLAKSCGDLKNTVILWEEIR